MIKKLICRIFGHKWMPWEEAGRLVGEEYISVTHWSEKCHRCGMVVNHQVTKKGTFAPSQLRQP